MIELPKRDAPGLLRTDHLILDWLARFAESHDREDRAALLPEAALPGVTPTRTGDLYPEMVGAARVDVREVLGMVRRLTEQLADAEAERDAWRATAERNAGIGAQL